MKNLVCFLEEPSAKEMLEGVLPAMSWKVFISVICALMKKD